MGQRSFFDVENRWQSVSKMGDPLERLAATIPWDSFRPQLAQVHQSYFGFKNPIGVDAEHKLIRTFKVTPANAHDNQVLGALTDPDNEDPEVSADNAYRSEEKEAVL